jgi:hypothetical protein
MVRSFTFAKGETMETVLEEAPVNGATVDSGEVADILDDDGDDPEPEYTEAEAAFLATAQGDAREKKIVEILAKAEARVIKYLLLAYDDTPDALKRHIRAGKYVHHYMHKVRNSIKGWRKTDYDDIAKIIEGKLARVSMTRIKPYDDHRAYLFIEAFKTLCPGVMSFKWGHVLHVMSTLVILNKADLDSKIKEGWTEFVKDYVTNSMGLIRDECYDAVKAFEKKLVDDADQKLTPDDRLKKIADRARAAKTAKVKSATSKVREAAKKALEVIDTPAQIVFALDEAGVVFDPSGIASLMQTALTACKPEELTKQIEQRGIQLPTSSPYDPATMTPAAAKAFTIALRDAGNWNAILILYKSLGELVAQMKSTATSVGTASIADAA